jgi:hypothetical protein
VFFLGVVTLGTRRGPRRVDVLELHGRFDPRHLHDRFGVLDAGRGPTVLLGRRFEARYGLPDFDRRRYGGQGHRMDAGRRYRAFGLALEALVLARPQYRRRNRLCRR